MSLALVFAAGCGSDDPGDANRCSGVSCDDGGVCDSGTGQCVNPSSCDSADVCLPGYSCDGGSCSADIECPDGVCARGICQARACVNPSVCQNNANCLEGDYCADGECKADPCADVTCDRGVCEVGTGECVNDICTSATEDSACLADHKCDDGTCVDEETFCAGLTCDRGVCDFDNLACGNANDCAGSDENCLEGSYCASDNTCQANLCVDGQCDRGVCDEGTGECVNSDSCGSESDCVDNFVCVGGACITNDDACGVGGCPGNQVCNYNDANSTAVCEEDAAGCSTSLDCLDERVCSAGTCQDPSACTDDEYEPNNMMGEETPYAGVPMEAGICSNDQDWFLFDTANDAQTIGTLIFDVTIPASEVGLGTLELELMDPSGTSIGTATTEVNGVQSNNARVTFAIDTGNAGVYTAIVRDSGNVTTAGVSYTLRLDVVNDDALQACDAVTETLLEGQAITGDTSMGASKTLTSDCADIDGLTPESIILLPIDAAKYITVTLTPLTATDLTFDIRRICDSDNSILDCADNAGTSGNEQLSIGLQPGMYYIVVQGASDTDNGPFAITYTSEPVICTPADNTCADASTLNMCNAFGTAFDAVTCSLGCDMAINDCTRPVGDDCSMPFTTPLPIVNEVVNHQDFTNQLDPGSSGCVPNNTGSSRGTDGPERVYEITIPDQKVLVASLARAPFTNAYGALYLVTDCGDLANTCLVGANDGRNNDESLFYYNDSGADMVVRLVVDTQDTGTTPVAQSILNVSLEDRACVPGESLCVLNRESQTCNDSGTGFDQTTTCEFGCDMTTNLCIKPTNETCLAAEILVPGTASTGDLNQYTSDYSDVCGAGSTSGGPDAIYVLQGIQAGSFVEIDFDTQSSAYAIWATSECNAADEMLGCVMDDDGFSSGVQTNSFVATAGGDYYIGVAPYSGTSTPGTFSLTATVTPPACTAGDVFGCDVNGTGIDYCNANSQNDTFTCSGGCAAGACVNPSGDACFDAITIPAPSNAACPPNTPATTLCGITTGDIVSAQNFLDIPSGAVGQCNLGNAGSEGELIHLFQLNAGELLTIDMTSSDTAVFGYFLDTCGDFNTCSGNSGQSRGDGVYTYYADITKDVYFVVDTNISFSFYDYDFLLQYQIDQSGTAQCAPGTYTCADPTTVQICDASAQATTFVCPTGCLNGACVGDSTVDSVCSTAQDVGTGGVFNFDWTDTNYQSAVDTSACAGDSDGREGYLSVTLQATDVLSVTATNITNPSGDDPVIRFFTDCNDEVGTCLAGARNTSGEAILRYQATTAETVLIAIDSDNQFTSYETFRVIVDVSPPECTSGTTQCGTVNSQAIEVCNSGLWEEVYTCSSTCSMGACGTPDGNGCFEPLPVDTTTAMSGTISEDWNDYDNTMSYSSSTQNGTCDTLDTSFSSAGPDTFFQFDLTAGQLLTVTLNAPDVSDFYWTYLTFLDNCLDDTNACVIGSSGGGPHVRTVSYFAETARSIVLAADVEASSQASAYTIDWAITTALCQPGQTGCGDATTLQICSADGSVAELFACVHSCNDPAGACDADANLDNFCDSAPVLASNKTIIKGNWADGYTNDLDWDASSSDNCTSTGNDPDGNELVYEVALTAGSLFRARATHAESSNDPQIYLITDCADPQGSCLAGDGGYSSTASFEYLSPIDQTVKFVADGSSTSTLGDFTIELEILVPDCDPATFVQACTTDGDAFEYCDANGFTRTYVCQGNNVCDATSNRCEQPEGEVCLDPLDGNPAQLGVAETFSDELGVYANDYDLGTGNACTGSRTIGPDPVYFVDLIAGQTLDVSLVSTAGTPEDVSVYIVSSCDDVRASCLAGSDSAGATATAETASYTATVDETVFVIVDSFYATSNGTFDLDVTVAAP